MKLMKVFETSKGMPGNVFQYLRNNGSFVEDGFGSYTVGAFAKEAAEDPEHYDPQEVVRAQRIDQWFIESGAVMDETVLVEHG